MEAVVKDGNLVITIPLESPTVSKSGKTLMVASSHGFQTTEARVADKNITVSVNAFIRSLTPLKSPYLTKDGSLTDAGKRGKSLFEGKAECIKCHIPPYYGDKKLYKLGLGSDNDRDCKFATPILIECWRTAPYMYDGRAVSIKDVITVDNKFNTHGNTKDLTDQEVDDLAEYVKTL